MTYQLVCFPTLANEIWYTEWWIRWVKNTILALVGAVLIMVAAKVNIPFYPVPMTMQTLVIFALSIIYGSSLGVFTIVLYLALGALGLPVLSGTPEKGIGLAYMLGPTGGYFVGFVMSSAIIGWLAEKGWTRRMATTFVAMLIGNIILYIPGLLWLGSVFGWDKPILEIGVLPFLWGDLFKIFLAMIMIHNICKVIKDRQVKS